MPRDLQPDLEHISENTSHIWPQLTGQNILVTGGTSFVGSWMLESLLHAGQRYPLQGRVLVVTRDPEAFRAGRPNLAKHPRVEIIGGNLKTVQIPDLEIPYIIHAAVEHEAPGRTAPETLAANLQGASRVLDIAKTRATKKILFTSSGAVYGPQPASLPKLPEDLVGVLEPANTYALSKRQSELLFSQSDAHVVIARLFAFMGPHLPLHKNFAVGNFIRDALRGGPIRVEGDGTSLRSYLHAADLTIWLWSLLLGGKSAYPYNVGNDQAVSILELAQTVERVCDVSGGIALAKTPLPGAEPKRFIPSIDRARAELNLRPLISLEDGIRRTFEWHKHCYTSTK